MKLPVIESPFLGKERAFKRLVSSLTAQLGSFFILECLSNRFSNLPSFLPGLVILLDRWP
jgi:hypothetical protein